MIEIEKHIVRFTTSECESLINLINLLQIKELQPNVEEILSAYKKIKNSLEDTSMNLYSQFELKNRLNKNIRHTQELGMNNTIILTTYDGKTNDGVHALCGILECGRTNPMYLKCE